MDAPLGYLPALEPELLVGLPALDQESIALMTSEGDVVVARQHTLATYRRKGSHCHCAHETEFREPVTALAESTTGLVAAAGGRVYIVQGHQAREIACLDGVVRSVAATATSVYAAVGRDGRLDGTLVEIDPRRSVIVSERSIRSAAVVLTTDATGSYLGIANGTTVRTIRTAQGTPCPEPPRAEPPNQEPTHAVDDGCVCHDKPPRGDHPPTRGQEPNAPPTERQPSSEPCDPGGAGIPTPDGGRVVGNGGSVTRHPPGSSPGRPANPCGLRVFFEVERVQLAGPHLVVTDRAARNVAVLAADDLGLLHQAQYRRGAVVLSNMSQPGMVLFDQGAQRWEHRLLEQFGKGALESVPAIDLVALNEPMTWTGAPMTVLRGERARAVGVKRVLVIPVIDPGQAFHDPDLPKLAAYMKRAGFSYVQRYYRENSFGELTDFEFVVHGVDVGSGGPVRLPKPVKDYYYPAYVGAHVDLVKPGLAFPATLVFDGREHLTLNVQSQAGGRAPTALDVRFYALLAAGTHDDFPAQVKFTGTETSTLTVKRPDGANTTLTLKFTPKTVDILDAGELKTKLAEIESYLDTVIATAEGVAGIPPRLFAKPQVRRVDQGTGGPGLLVTTLRNASVSGGKLELGAITYTGAQDPLGLKSALTGRMSVSTATTNNLQQYLGLATVLAQEAAGFDHNARRLDTDPVVTVDGTRLVSQLFISKEDGGPGATMTVSNAVDMGVLFDAATSVANTDVTSGRSETPRDGNAGLDGLVSDVFTAAVDRLAAPGMHLQKKADIDAFFNPPGRPYDAVMMGVVHPATADADKDFPRPEEMWNAGPTSWGGVRAVEAPRTAVFRPNPKEIQLFANWSLVPFSTKAYWQLFCHELGHAIGFDDLYARAAGYRNDVNFMGQWAMMDSHDSRSHHCGFHKWQAGWITDNRVRTIGRPKEDETRVEEVLLVPVEHWHANDALVGAARAAFGRPSLPVVQLVELDLGADADVFGLIEARQRGDEFSDQLPFDPAVLVTNCIAWWDKTRYAFNGKYRAPVHLLHSGGELRKAGDSLDLATGREFPAKGIVVSVVDRKTVSGVEVFHIKVERKHSREFIDLYFSSADPYYKNPDLWVDWAGDNGPGGRTSSRDPKDARLYPLGEPVDQGEKIRVPDTGDELHWMTARLRNIGNVRAEQVKLNFSMCEPPGAGDNGNFKVRDSIIVPVVHPTGRDKPVHVSSAWAVPAGFSGHTCIMVEIADLTVPRDHTGAALASDDVWQANNRAQKNVDQIGPTHDSPYEPVPFEYSVNNSGRMPEVVYLEPEALPQGMTLTVFPKRRKIAAGETAIFRCTLQLDDKVIDASCRGDHDFRINAWRVDGESSILWGGVEYQVRPRKRSAADVKGSWDWNDLVEISGHVSPGNITGQVRVRLAYTGHFARWVTVDLLPGGTFSYKERAPANTRELLVNALFEGNKYYSESKSPQRKVTPPPPVR